MTAQAYLTKAVSFPLLGPVVGTGATTGNITSVGSNYVDVTGAGWTPGAFSNVATPYILRITSGSAAGRVIPVSTTANTATRIYLNNEGFALDLVVGPASGDSYELTLADTLGSFFGTTLLGGTDSTNADNVMIWASGSWITYYYNTTRSRWERDTDTAASSSRNNVLLRQDRGFMLVRKASTDFTFYVTGRVPNCAPYHLTTIPGTTFFSTSLPVPVTLGTLALQTRATDWKGAADPSTALTNGDLVQIWASTTWLNYYYDTTRNSWQRSTDNSMSGSRNGVEIPAGVSFMIRRIDNAANNADRFVQMPLPYTGF